MRRILLLSLVALLFGLTLSAADASAQENVQFTRLLTALRAKAVSEPDQVLKQSATLAQLANDADPTQAAAVNWLRAECHARLGDAAEARRLVDAGLLGVQGRGTAIEGDLLRTRGDIATDAGEVAAALADYQAAYRVYAAHKNMRGRALALTSIASLYRQGGDFESALRYLGQAIDIGGDPTMMASIYNNRGNVLSEIRKDALALRDFQRALIFVGRTNNSAFAARIWGNLARSQVAVGDYRTAWQSVSRGMAIARRQESRQAIDALQSISARIAMQRGDRAEAVRLIDRIFDGVDLKTTSLGARDNHRNAYVVYAAAGETKKALAHLEALNRLDDQATQVATSAKTALMSARFDFQNQELRIAGLKQEELRRNVAFERSQARFERILFGIGGVAVAIVIAALGFGVVTLRRSRDEVRGANAELETTNVALGKALKARTDFLATTSHEIRTPLNGILGMTQVMLADKTLPAATRERLGVVQGAGLAMRALVDDILDVAKMASGQLAVAVEPLDPTATLADVAHMWRTQAEDRGLSFTVDIGTLPPWIESDPARLRQIVDNLLSNALKFTAHGGIGLRAEAVGDRLRIAVSDSGIGVPADRQGDVFESFRQADTSTTRRYGGTGLGLTICRNLARALGGDILLDSVEGEGSVFTVDLPLKPTNPVAADASGGEELVILEANPIARGKLRGLLGERVAGLAFADAPNAMIAGIAEGRHQRALIDLLSLRAVSIDPVGDLRRIAMVVREAGGRAVLLAPVADVPPVAIDPIQVLLKPVSGAKLVATILESAERNDGADALLYPTRHGAIAALNMPEIIAPTTLARRNAS